MSAYRMRPMTAADAPFVIALHRLEHVAASLNEPSEEQVLGSLERPNVGNLVVVDERETRVGMLLLIDQEDAWIFEVRRIAAAQQGIGIGSFALEWALRHAFDERGAHRVYLEVHASNARARRLYEAHGFVLEGIMRESARHEHDGRYEDLCAYGILDREYNTPTKL